MASARSAVMARRRSVAVSTSASVVRVRSLMVEIVPATIATVRPIDRAQSRTNSTMLSVSRLRMAWRVAVGAAGICYLGQDGGQRGIDRWVHPRLDGDRRPSPEG